MSIADPADNRYCDTTPFQSDRSNYLTNPNKEVRQYPIKKEENREVEKLKLTLTKKIENRK